MRDIGTKFVKSKIQLPHLTNNRCKKLTYIVKLRSIDSLDKTDRNALSRVIDIWAKNIAATIIPILN